MGAVVLSHTAFNLDRRMKLAMDTSKTQGDMLASLIGETAKGPDMSVQPHLGASVDVRG